MSFRVVFVEPFVEVLCGLAGARVAFVVNNKSDGGAGDFGVPLLADQEGAVHNDENGFAPAEGGLHGPPPVGRFVGNEVADDKAGAGTAAFKDIANHRGLFAKPEHKGSWGLVSKGSEQSVTETRLASAGGVGVHSRFEFIANRGIQCVLLMWPELRENTSGHRESMEDYSQLLSLKASNFKL